MRRLRELLRSGDLGAPYYIHATRVNLGRLRSDETALWCFGPHDLSMIDYITGETPEMVSACGQAMSGPGIEDVVFMTLRDPSRDDRKISICRGYIRARSAGSRCVLAENGRVG